MARTKQTARKAYAYASHEIAEEEHKDPPGTKVEWKHVDEIYDEKLGAWVYRDSAPFAAGTEIKDPYRDYCFVLNRKFEPGSMQVTTTVQIKSEKLRDACAAAIGKIPPVSFQVPRVSIDPKILLTFHPALCEHLDSLKLTLPEDDLTVAQLDLLIDFLETTYETDLENFQTLITNGEISFEYLWALFVPNKEYYTTDHRTGQPRAVILKWATLGSSFMGSYYALDCEYIESFGHSKVHSHKYASRAQKFGRGSFSSIIMAFQGVQKIHALKTFPFEYHPRQKEMRQMLIERGKKWAAHDSMHHKMYKGIAYMEEGKKVNSRIVLDKASFRRIKPNWRDMGLPKSGAYDDEDDYDYEDDMTIADQIEIEDGKTIRLPSNKDRLKEEDYVIATPFIYGFALSEKEWAEFDIDCVEDIVWNDTAFENLKLPAEQKALIQALVEAHGKLKFDDFITGKGQGLVMNLFGPPGVGKTMSAEATSEHLRKPLYVVGAGELGVVPSALDKRLNEIFDIAYTWGAIILIDEADIFLEKRSLHDLDRNELVSIFLRHLEYFAGILFLTTNRVETFDNAFQSRIHVALKYNELDEEIRSAIWKAFLAKIDVHIIAPNDGEDSSTEGSVVKSTLTEEELKLLAEKPVNGRQIKNAVRTAQALSLSSGKPLSLAHLMQVLRIMEQFQVDLKGSAV